MFRSWACRSDCTFSVLKISCWARHRVSQRKEPQEKKRRNSTVERVWLAMKTAARSFSPVALGIYLLCQQLLGHAWVDHRSVNVEHGRGTFSRITSTINWGKACYPLFLNAPFLQQKSTKNSGKAQNGYIELTLISLTTKPATTR